MHNPPEASAPWCLVVTLAVIIEVKCSRTTEQDHPTINYTKVTELIIKCRVPHKECRVSSTSSNSLLHAYCKSYEPTMENTLQFYESKELVQNYTKYRPTHPRQLLDKIFTFQGKHHVGNELALDLACGSGQTAFDICSRFQRTIGIDISKEQIASAQEKASTLDKPANDVQFVVASASKLPLENESVDLITCSVAWHWLDPETVFAEIDRVLKRPGILAVSTYCFETIRQQYCNKLFSLLLDHATIWQDGPYGNVRDVIANHYKDVKLPYPLAERHDMIQESSITLQELQGFVTSWDSYDTYCQKNPGNTTLEDTMEKMRMTLIEESVDTSRTQLSDLTLVMERPFCLLLTVKS